MKKVLLACAICLAGYASCADKIYNLEKELDYAKRYNNIHKEQNIRRALDNVRARCGGSYSANYYDDYKYKQKTLERDYDSKIDLIEDELDRLDDIKDTMSKSEYKARKNELKAHKKALKNEYKLKKDQLKHNYKY